MAKPKKVRNVPTGKEKYDTEGYPLTYDVSGKAKPIFDEEEFETIKDLKVYKKRLSRRMSYVFNELGKRVLDPAAGTGKFPISDISPKDAAYLEGVKNKYSADTGGRDIFLDIIGASSLSIDALKELGKELNPSKNPQPVREEISLEVVRLTEKYAI